MKRPAYKYTDMIHRCFRCGYCKFPTDWEDITNCPAYARFRLESYSPGGRLWLIRAWVNGEMEWTEHLASIIYACAACKNCVEKCPLNFSDDIVNMVIAAKNAMVELGLLPSSVKTLKPFWKMFNYTETHMVFPPKKEVNGWREFR